MFAADEWRRNHDCFSKYWLSPHRIFHEVIFTGRTRSSVLDARVIEIDLRNMRRLAEIGREVFFGGKLLRARRHAKISRQQYADELVAYDHARKDYAGIVPLFDPAPVWLRRPADRYLPEYFTVPRVYSLTINTAATAQPETEFYGWQYDHPSAAWPLVWSEKDRRGRWRVVDTRPITDNASRRMADLVIAIDNLGDTNAKPERHDVVRVGGDLHSDHGIDRGDIRPID